MKKISVKTIVGTAILSAISILLYIFVKFPLPLFPSFLEIQISELPLIICGYIYGPVSALVALLIRFLVKLPLSHTGMVGEIGDLLIAIPLLLITSLTYKKKKTFKRAILFYIVGILFSTLMAMLVNQFILIPFYSSNFGFDAIIGMCQMIKGINESNFMLYYLLLAVLPFNLFRYIIVGIFTFLLYKKVHYLLDKIK